MGSAFSKPPPTVKPRNDDRIKGAREHIEPIVAALESLNEKIQGQVVLAPKLGADETSSTADEIYHEHRERPFYLNDANYPSAIVLVKTHEDVCEAVKFVASLDTAKYKLCIAGGCHSAYCMVDHSIVVDMKNLNECVVDTDALCMTIGGGAKIEDAHAALKGTGYGFATGTNGDTGISGLTMAGGAGYLGGTAGYGCDTVTAAKVVLPSGELVTATDDNEHADLLRALRGGGGNFGVVVEWTFKIYDVSNVLGGTVVQMCPTMNSIKRVFTHYAECLEDIPDECYSICALPAGAPVFANVLTMIGPDTPKEVAEVPFFQRICKLDGAWFKISNDLGRKDYIEEVTVMLEPLQKRTFGVALGAMVYSFDEAMRDALIHFARVDYPKKNKRGSAILVLGLTGEMRRNDGSKSSLRHRKAQAWVVVNGEWDPWASEEDIQAVKDWTKRIKAKIVELGGEDGPHNFCDTDGRRIKFFTDEQRSFLEGAKKKYDPNNLMTLNKNIISHAE
ncbi:linked oxidoreductase DDB_G0289697 [Seminavis robusta]|uniref:Linked oxidoreductase DDB_G0289697 n=1 Tax=Seminavis robusta TaxID=568900 RepID=A0A9N8EPJ1_9STRA|nr:linked oxidoreductase DDB_G0289697 [Seminavis robusta]|eukprot:Sro1378_g267630.1 linked oxidoreductase DDB_G0289697 (506) ;mRNA; r:10777-12294